MEHKVLKSKNENVCKFIFTKDSDITVEAVLYRYNSYKERTVICCSTQCGCPMGCGFCGTGNFFKRNLTSDEIVEQVTTIMNYVNTDSNSINKFQIMFMSMGEPILNIDNVIEAMKALHLLYPNAQLLISTVAPKTPLDKYMKLIDYAKINNKVGLQVSVHESTDGGRSSLIKAKSMPLRIIGHIGELFFKETGRQPFFNYCVHEGNSSDSDICNLTKNLYPSMWQCTLSVICEKDESVKSSIERQLDLIDDFNQRMMDIGYSTRVFNPAGQDDIGGGCGQLWYFQQWYKNNKNNKL